MKSTKVSKHVGYAAAALALVACGSPPDTAQEEATPTYTLAGTYSASSTTAFTKFASLTFTDGSDTFAGVKANCTSGCAIAGTYVFDTRSNRLRLTYDGLTDSLAFAADAQSATPKSGTTKTASLRVQSVGLGPLSVQPQCVVASADGNDKTNAGGSAAGGGNSLLGGGVNSILSGAISFLVKSFDLQEDDTTESTGAATGNGTAGGATPTSLRVLDQPLLAVSGSGRSTTMNVAGDNCGTTAQTNSEGMYVTASDEANNSVVLVCSAKNPKAGWVKVGGVKYAATVSTDVGIAIFSAKTKFGASEYASQFTGSDAVTSTIKGKAGRSFGFTSVTNRDLGGCGLSSDRPSAGSTASGGNCDYDRLLACLAPGTTNVTGGGGGACVSKYCKGSGTVKCDVTELTRCASGKAGKACVAPPTCNRSADPLF